MLALIDRSVPPVTWDSMTDHPDLTDLAGTLTPFASFNVGTLLVQSGIVILVFLLLNGWLAGSSTPEASSEEPLEPAEIPAGVT